MNVSATENFYHIKFWMNWQIHYMRKLNQETGLTTYYLFTGFLEQNKRPAKLLY